MHHSDPRNVAAFMNLVRPSDMQPETNPKTASSKVRMPSHSFDPGIASAKHTYICHVFFPYIFLIRSRKLYSSTTAVPDAVTMSMFPPCPSTS